MNLRTKLFLTFLPISLAAILVSSIVYYFHFKKALFREATDKLEIINNFQRERVNDFVSVNKDRFSRIRKREILNRKLSEYAQTGNPDNLRSLSRLAGILSSVILEINQITIIDSSGTIIASSEVDYPGKVYGSVPTENLLKDSLIFEIVKSSNGIRELSMTAAFQQKGYYLNVTSPVSPLEELISEFQEFSSSGETVIFTPTEEGLRMITPLRFDTSLVMLPYGHLPVMPTEVSLSSTEKLPSDYRGKQVMSTAGLVPEVRWLVVTKIDLDEVLEPVAQVKVVVIGGTILVILACFFLTFFYSRLLLTGLMKLEESMQSFKAGERCEPVTMKSKDEIASLAASFNSMCSELEKTHRDLQENIKKLQQANEDLDSFAYTVSHDLKAPLRGMRFLAQTFEEDYTEHLDGNGQELLRLFKEKAAQMDAMIKGILQYSRQGRDSHQEEFSASEVVDEVVHNLDMENQKGLRIHMKNTKLRMDRTAFTQVIQNLLSNAAKYSDKKNPEIRIVEKETKEKIVYEIWDNGPGIPEQYKHRLFRMFGTIPGISDNESSGVGLAIVKKIVDAEGGSYGIRNNPQGGSIFWIELPRDLS